ncbi:MAG: lipid-binding SYLF domain-containing protein [Thermodesulfobacteriota bacterium]
MSRPRIACVLAALLILILTAGPALAAGKAEAELEVLAAGVVLDKMMQQGDKSVPQDLLKRCRAVALFPGVIKAGFILGGQGGSGVVLARHDDGSWSPPAFFNLAGASLGLQIGAQSTDLMLVIMTKKGLEGLLKNKVQLGADASVALGPTGRRVLAGTTGSGLAPDVYAYSMSKGLFMGISLDGAGLEYDAETTNAYYGFAESVRSILLEGKVKQQASSRQLIKQLRRYGR